MARKIVMIARGVSFSMDYEYLPTGFQREVAHNLLQKTPKLYLSKSSVFVERIILEFLQPEEYP